MSSYDFRLWSSQPSVIHLPAQQADMAHSVIFNHSTAMLYWQLTGGQVATRFFYRTSTRNGK